MSHEMQEVSLENAVSPAEEHNGSFVRRFWQRHSQDILLLAFLFIVSLVWKLSLLERLPLAMRFAADADCPCRANLGKMWALNKNFRPSGSLIWLPGHFWLLGTLWSWLGNLDKLAIILEWIAGFFSVLLTFAVARKCTSRAGAFFAAILFLTLPAQNELSSMSHSNMLFSFVFLLAAWQYCSWLGSRKPSVLFTAGFFLTLSCTFRYEGWFFTMVAAGTTFLLWLIEPNKKRNLIAYSPILVSAAFPIFWLYQNYVVYGDPMRVFRIMSQIAMQKENFRPLGMRLSNQIMFFIAPSPLIAVLGLVGTILLVTSSVRLRARLRSAKDPLSEQVSPPAGNGCGAGAPDSSRSAASSWIKKMFSRESFLWNRYVNKEQEPPPIAIRFISSLTILGILYAVKRQIATDAGGMPRHAIHYVFLWTIPAGAAVGLLWRRWNTLLGRVAIIVLTVVFAWTQFLSAHADPYYGIGIGKTLHRYKQLVTLDEYEGDTHIEITEEKHIRYLNFISASNNLRRNTKRGLPRVYDSKRRGHWVMTFDESTRNRACAKFNVIHQLLSPYVSDGFNALYLTNRHPADYPKKASPTSFGPIDLVGYLPGPVPDGETVAGRKGYDRSCRGRIFFRHVRKSNEEILLAIIFRTPYDGVIRQRHFLGFKLSDATLGKTIVLHSDIPVYPSVDGPLEAEIMLSVLSGEYQPLGNFLKTGAIQILPRRSNDPFIILDGGEFNSESIPYREFLKQIDLEENRSIASEAVLLWKGRSSTKKDFEMVLNINGREVAAFPNWMFKYAQSWKPAWFSYRFDGSLLKEGKNDISFIVKGDGNFLFSVDKAFGPLSGSYGRTPTRNNNKWYEVAYPNGKPGDLAIRLHTKPPLSGHPYPPGLDVISLNVDHEPIDELTKMKKPKPPKK